MTESASPVANQTPGTGRTAFLLRLGFGIVGTIMIIGLVYLSGHLSRGNQTPPPDNAAAIEPFSYPPPLSSIWPGITVRVDSLVRVNSTVLTAEWTYLNGMPETSPPFSWGREQPNFVALSQIIDADGRAYPVAMAGDGRLVCADTNQADNPEQSRKIYGGRGLPAWAEFHVPKSAKQPYRLSLYGIKYKNQNSIPVPLLSMAEQIARAAIPRQSSWPDIWLRFTGVERLPGNRLRVHWQYLNRNKTEAFSWGYNQPNFVAHTQLYDYADSRLHSVASRPNACSSTNKDDQSGWSRTIPPGGAMDAFAEFDQVTGDRIQLIFHAAAPLVIQARKKTPPPAKTPNTN